MQNVYLLSFLHGWWLGTLVVLISIDFSTLHNIQWNWINTYKEDDNTRRLGVGPVGMHVCIKNYHMNNV